MRFRRCEGSAEKRVDLSCLQIGRILATEGTAHLHHQMAGEPVGRLSWIQRLFSDELRVESSNCLPQRAGEEVISWSRCQIRQALAPASRRADNTLDPDCSESYLT